MEKNTPRWALEKATPQDRQRTIDAYHNGLWQITWPDAQALRTWAKAHRWPGRGFLSDTKFFNKMLENDENFALALKESGVQVHIPRQEYTISVQQLEEMDDLYEARQDMGVLGSRPVGWGALVSELREIRRAIEAGVTIQVEDEKLGDVGSFLIWAHARYHMLEDGYDSWYGDDKS